MNLIKNTSKSIFFFFIFTLAAASLFAQEVGFMGINIGMSREEVLTSADENEIIEVPRNRDVEFFPVEDRKILTFSIKPEVPHIYLQFYDDRLYALTLIFNEKHIDYYTLINRLENKYGAYTELTPEWRKWAKDEVEIKAEKPAVVKYLALKEFLEAAGFKVQDEDIEGKRKDRILDGL